MGKIFCLFSRNKLLGGEEISYSQLFTHNGENENVKKCWEFQEYVWECWNVASRNLIRKRFYDHFRMKFYGEKFWIKLIFLMNLSASLLVGCIYK